MSLSLSIDNPIWLALTTRQRALGEHGDRAARFAPDVSILAGFDPVGGPARGLSALAAMLQVGERAGVFYPGEASAVDGLAIVLAAPLVQMIYLGDEADAVGGADIVQLGPADVPAMMALAERTKPGPFNVRTAEMGEFAGIVEGGALVAMAGQRLRAPGFIEVSAICTHPDHAGRGLGARLTRWQIARIFAAGDRPFLHVRGDNARAIALYARLGFEETARGTYAILERGAVSA